MTLQRVHALAARDDDGSAVILDLLADCLLYTSHLAELPVEGNGQITVRDDRARAMVADGNLAIALHGEFGQVLALAIPTRDAVELVECDPLLGHDRLSQLLLHALSGVALLSGGRDDDTIL